MTIVVSSMETRFGISVGGLITLGYLELESLGLSMVMDGNIFTTEIKRVNGLGAHSEGCSTS